MSNVQSIQEANLAIQRLEQRIASLTSEVKYFSTVQPPAVTTVKENKFNPLTGFGPWITWTPTITASGSMTITSIVINEALYIQVGPITFFKIYIQGLIGGTLGPAINVTLPFTNVGQYTNFSLIHGPVNAWTPAVGYVIANDIKASFIRPGLVAYTADTWLFMGAGFYRTT